MKKNFVNQSGMALLGVLILTAVILLLITGFLVLNKSGLKITANLTKKLGTRYAAESALGVATSNLYQKLVATSDVASLHETPSFEFNDVAYTGTQADYSRSHFINSSCIPLQPEALSTNQKTEACTYLADRYELLPKKIDDAIDTNIKSITKMDGSAGEEDLRKFLANKWQMPTTVANKLMSGFFSQREVYNIVVNATNPASGEVTNLEGRIGAYNTPAFQMLILSNYPLHVAPFGATYVLLKGRIHSNQGVTLGILGDNASYNNLTVSPIDFLPGSIAVSSSQDIWEQYKYIHVVANGTHDIHLYFKGKVAVETNSGVYEPFVNSTGTKDHILPVNYVSSDKIFTAWTECYHDTPNCWDINNEATSGYWFEYNKVSADDPEFNNRLAVHTDRIEPMWLSNLSKLPEYATAKSSNDTATMENLQREYIETMKSTDADNDNFWKKNKLIYRSNIRIVKDSSGNAKSVDSSGNEITLTDASLGKYSIDTLKDSSTGFIKITPARFYDTRLGRLADIIEIDVSKLKTNYPTVSSVYVGTESLPRGEIHTPTPNCDPSKNYDLGVTATPFYSPICRNGSGADCYDSTNKSCNSSMIGSYDAVMVRKGTELPAGGLTVSSNAPVFLQGDYNTVNKKPAMIAADTVTYLSNSWSDDPSDPNPNWAPTRTNLGIPQVTSDTTYNLAIMDGANYEGDIQMPGLEAWEDSNGYKYKLIRNLSYLRMWTTKYFPPKAGTFTMHDWDREGFAYYFATPNYITSQDTFLALNPPPLSDNMNYLAVELLSTKEIENEK